MTGVILVGRTPKALSAVCSAKPLSLHRMAGTALISRQLHALRTAGASGALVIAAEDRGLSAWISKLPNGFTVDFALSKGMPPLAFLAEYAKSFFKNTREPFILTDGAAVISGEALGELFCNHRELAADVSVLMKETENPDEPVFSVSALNRVEGIFSPPSVDYSYSDFTYAGAAVLSAESLFAAHGRQLREPVGDLLPCLLGHASIYGYLPETSPLFIRSPKSYREAVAHFIREEPRKADIPNAVSPVFLGEKGEIEPTATVGPLTQTGVGVKIGGDSSVRFSVVGDCVKIGYNCRLDGAVVLDGAEIKDGASVLENAVVGAGATVGDGCVITRGVTLPEFRAVGTDSSAPLRMSGEDAYDAGKKAGAASETVAVGYYSDTDMKIASLFSDGAAAAGASVFIADSVPECVWRFAANRLGSDCGAYFGEKGTVFSSFCGADAVLTPPERFSGGRTGSKETLGGLYRLYTESVARFAVPLPSATVRCDNAMLSGIYSRFLGDGGDSLSFFAASDGVCFSVSDEKGVYIGEERTPQLAAFCALVADGFVYLPESFPLADRLLERATGGKIIRVAPTERRFQEEALRFLDAAFRISRIGAALEKTSKPLFELSQAVPPYFLKNVTLPAAQTRRSLSRLFGSETASLTPPVIQTESGAAFAVWSKRRPEIVVTAVSDSEAGCDSVLCAVTGL